MQLLPFIRKFRDAKEVTVKPVREEVALCDEGEESASDEESASNEEVAA